MSNSPDRPAIPSTATDLELLRAFEPVVRFTSGELFFPMDVERYLRASSLWLYHPDDHDEQVVPEGELTIEKLVEPRTAQFGSVFYVRFVHPLSLDESARTLRSLQHLKRRPNYTFRTGLGRLARGGLVPRLMDALFSASLLLRGRVPTATAAAAALEYADMQRHGEKYVYHGRVVREGGWTVCQYWLFYAYNNWRSGFHGVNDHESDWELVNVYLYERDGRLVPEWVAYSSHDFHGADLRRRWDDDTDLTLDGSHPVVYAGAGSHASYYQQGEYQAEVPVTIPTRIREALETVERFWRRTLGQVEAGESAFRVPFVDFARGDGFSVGPGQDREWTANPISEATPWVADYRGLWGLYAQDPISGENAPAGPMYNRDGSPRSSWFDSLGFAELDRVPPPPLELEVLEDECAALRERQAELEALIPERSRTLQRLGTRLESMEGTPHLEKPHERLENETARQTAELKSLRSEQSENDALLDRMTLRLERLRAGRHDDPRAHIRNAAEPMLPAHVRFSRAAEIWAAVSLSLLLVGLVALIEFAPEDAWAGAIVLLIGVVVAESVLRATFVRTVNRVAVVLALVATVILLVHFWEEVLVGALVALAAFLILQRVRELRA
jgi:hypothetical protein